MDPLLRSLTVAFLLCQSMAFAQQKTATRPAWTSTLQCLAPLAREARSGKGTLSLEQAFFDGPFSFPSLPMEENHFPVVWPENEFDRVTRRHLGAGFSYLLAFDDYRAAQHFRAVIQQPSGQVPGFIGLALINSDDPRRFSCFLDAAREIAEGTDGMGVKWVELLSEHFVNSGFSESDALLSKWADLTKEHANACLAAAGLRLATLLQIQGVPRNQVESSIERLSPLLPGWIPDFWNAGTSQKRLKSAEPLPVFLQSQPRLLRLAGNLAPEHILAAEANRLQAIQSLMPEATLDLGAFSRKTLFDLPSQSALPYAENLLGLPRDAHSPGTRFRRLASTDTSWRVARAHMARRFFEENKWEALLHMRRGFLPEERSEYFSWQIVASAVQGADYNPWLAALRREPNSDDLVEQCEKFLESLASPDENISYQITGIPEGTHLQPSPQPPLDEIATQPILAFPWEPRPAADFSLPDWRNEKLTLSEWRGQPVLVIFFLGGGCLHCVEQLRAFGPWNQRFEDAGIDILAVSTDPVEILRETLAGEENVEKDYPIPIVSDEPLDTFKEWRVFDEFDQRAIHGTFLLNADSEIIWEEKGNAPYMHPDFLLHEATRLLAKQ
ncbi:MAG: peroxiredoxin family protein [Verrucomicrobiota bacterium]